MADSAVSGAVTAQTALDAVQRYPREAIAIGRRVLAAGHPDADERSTAERAIGLALRELNDLPGALRHLRRAVRIAGTPRVRALAQMSLGYVLANAGRTVAALRAVTLALPRLTGADAGRARMQRGVVLHYRGRFDEAVRDYDIAVEIAQREGDLLLEARARNNRGLLNAHRGTSRDADDDLFRSAAIFSRLGLDLAAADARWNIGIAAGQRGDVAGALRGFATVDDEYRRLSVPRPALLLDRFELLLSVPLVDEAVEVATSAVTELRRRGMASDLAEALLARARAALLAGDLDTATGAAASARARFRRQGRRIWAAFARHVELRAEFSRGTRSAALLTAMVRTADQLDATGWPSPALTTRIEAARLAEALGRPARAAELLAVAARAHRRGTAPHRAQGWYALALRRRLDGDPRGATRALRRGLAVLDGHRASLGATELRAHSGAYGHELAAEGLDIAVRTGTPAQVLAWAERWRANALRMRAVQPPQDPELATALAELRMVSTALEDALLAGHPVHALRRSQGRLEQRIRELARGVDGGARAVDGGGLVAPPAVHALATALGDAVLLELVAHGPRLRAVLVRDGRTSLHDLGPLDEALGRARLHRFGLRRLVTTGDSASARAGVEFATTALDQQLFDPVRRLLGDRPLVIVPIGALHAVPWSGLPTCAGRPVTVAPSATVWLRAVGRIVPAGPPVLVAGPRLPAAETEVRQLGAALPGSRPLTGCGATADAVTDALNGTGLAHIAAHGTFRADNPLFSTLELADGPLTAYELERLTRPPGCVVLSACDSGLSGVRPGDEVMGFTAVLLALGARSLIATVLPVPGDLTTALMLDLHRRMRAGAPPAVALAEAQRTFDTAGGGGAAHATAAAFVCFGAG
ncbi:CHAT domain-containing tetratricopeptide repeat protein [Micromonospora peucetia]|uniref:CHAT domain-containing tetratricopeptide repeat protein n=1 Tax=Micromonospora peucetia TaxID=47871 RepID=A0A1C6V0E0_9ACTN|nr:CHAT domain-containing tetratricopeptide repeat protein [Micromonospora peucetia]MCX4391321.1 CHAT domain-containing tetratricopeptide repeat protein [Micromonospora peucetia]WSA35126.1 CHAT domain-containing tetratricopeptide repeat protein [Micromonospora peucetia]SCL59574.1 Tetratricopeptide repeat-containing protein [Micromonospora peucetia]